MKRILQPGENCAGIYDVHESGLLVDGRDYYRAFSEAATRARRYILLAGWQFDSGVRLLRGEDDASGGDTRLLAFLNRLCEEKPELHVYILAWDFAELYLLDREWFQKWVFEWTTSERLRFRFDDRHAVGASHHEKFAVIDGTMAFLGGMDICESRWDDRNHRAENPERRNPGGKPYGPFHDIQSFHGGPMARELTKHFRTRWENSGGEALVLAPPGGDISNEMRVTLPLHASEAAISRTRAETIAPRQGPVHEIRGLYTAAVRAAEKLIYVENQYFSSEAVYQALMERLQERDRPKLQVVVVLPKSQHTLSEALAFGLTQAKMLTSLRDVASREGHAMGIYYPVAEPPGRAIPVYVHSKLLVVDDRFMTLGSANASNRSMGLDTELNVSWEAHEEHEELAASIRAARSDLLREHAGTGNSGEVDFGIMEGLVERLEELTGSPQCRLRRHTMETVIDERVVPKNFKPADLMLDTEKPVVEENVFELISHDKTGIFSAGITILSDVLIRREAGKAKRLLRVMRKRWWVPLGAALLAALVAWLLLR